MLHARRFFCIVMTCCALAAFGKEQVFHDATPQELAMKNVAMAPGATAAVLQWDHRQDDFASWESEYVRIKIFDRGAEKYGDVELPYYPGYTWIKELQARTIHADGTVVPFSGKTYDKLIVKASGVKVMAKTFSLPDIQPGSILEYFYVRAWNPDRLASSRWVVQREIPVLKATIWLKPYTQVYSSFFTFQGLPPGKQPVRVGDHFELALENMPAYDEEPYSPPALAEKARVDFLYTLGDTDPDKFWKKAGEDFTDAAESFIGRNPMQAEATLVTKGATTDEQRLKLIYDRVQKIRNLSYEPEKTEKEEHREKLRENKSVYDVWNNGYGWRGEITRLFVSLARGAGLTANVVRAASRDDLFFAQQIPDNSQLDTELALVEIGGKQRFLDPGTPFAPLGTLRWEVSAVPALKLAKKQPAVFIETPHLQPVDSLLTRKADLHVDGDVVKGTVTLTYTGERALVRRLDGRNDDEAKNRKTMEDDVKGWLPDGSTVKLKSYGPLKGTDEPLVAVLDVEMPNLGSSAGSRTLLPLSIFSASAHNPFAVESRKHDIYFEYERQTDDEVVLHIPEGYSIESVPQGQKDNLAALVFTTQWDHDANSVTFKRSLAINTLAIERNYYPQVRSFYKRVSTADQDNLILKKAAK